MRLIRDADSNSEPLLRVLALSATPTADERWAQQETFEDGLHTLLSNLAVRPATSATFVCPSSEFQDELRKYVIDLPWAEWTWNSDPHESNLHEMLSKGPTKDGATRIPLGRVGRLALCVLKILGARAAAVYLTDCLQRVDYAKTPLTLGQVEQVKQARIKGKETSSLVDALRKQLGKSVAKRILVLTQEKLATRLLVWVLRHQQHELSTDFITGQSGAPHIKGMPRAVLQKRLDEFEKSGKRKILVATDVVEEGLDVSSCQLVVRTEPSQTVRKCVQARGRVRKRDDKEAQYAVLTASDGEHEKAEKNKDGNLRIFDWLFEYQKRQARE